VSGIYHPRHPERTILYRVLLHHFERFLAEYEGRFEKDYGHFRPVLALDRLLFLERESKVGYQWGREAAELETTDYLEFIARVTSHIPDKGQVMVRYYGLCANAQIHPSPGGDVRDREGATRPCLRAGRLDGGRGERGVRIAGDLERGGVWTRLVAFWTDPTDDPPAGATGRWTLGS
jgi:hypothetical protein